MGSGHHEPTIIATGLVGCLPTPGCLGFLPPKGQNQILLNRKSCLDNPYLEVMASAKKDIEQLGLPAPEVYCKLANIGSGGTQKGNMHRDLLKLVNVKVPAGFQVDVPVRGHQPGTWKNETQHMLLPHVLFAHMWENEEQAFQQFIQGGPGQIEAFWNEMAASPQLANHPLRHVPDYQHVAIPIAIHGDGVPVTGVGKSWSKSCDIYSWASLLGGGRMALKEGGHINPKRLGFMCFVFFCFSRGWILGMFLLCWFGTSKLGLSW